MPEVPSVGEEQAQAKILCGRRYVLVVARARRCHDGGDAGRRQGVDGISKREEAIGSGYRPLGPVSGTVEGAVHGSHPALIAGPDPDGGSVPGHYHRIRFGVGRYHESQTKVGQLLRGLGRVPEAVRHVAPRGGPAGPAIGPLVGARAACHRLAVIHE